MVFFFPLPLDEYANVINTDTYIAADDLSYDGQDIIIESCMVTIDGTHSFQSLIIDNGGILTHSQGVDTFDLTITGDLIIDLNGLITADGKGFGSHTGPGAGGCTTYFQSTGAGEGGHGAHSQGQGGIAYGSITEPNDLGSGGGYQQLYNGQDPGGAGGGALRLNIGGTFLLNGILSANGSPGTGNSGGGSGGNIYVLTSVIDGEESIAVDCGNAPTLGGGGRIVV